MFFRLSRKQDATDTALVETIGVLELMQKHYGGLNPLGRNAEVKVNSVRSELALAAEYYDHMHAALPAGHPMLTAETSKEAFIQSQADALRRGLISKYETPDSQFMLDYLKKKIVAAAMKTKMESTRQPVFGTLSTGRINGMAVGVKNDKYCLILLENGLFGFANLFSKCIVGMLPIKQHENGGQTISIEKSEILSAIVENADMRARFFEAIAAYIIRGSPHAAAQYFIKPEQFWLQMPFLSGMEYFVVGHELGHCSAGHLQRGRRRSLALPEGGDQLNIEEVVPDDWKMEFEADYRGLVLALTALADESVSPKVGYAAVEVFFSCIDVIERALSIIKTGIIQKTVLDTHPPTSYRRETLRRMLANILDDEQRMEAIRLADAVHGAIELTWRGVEPIFQQMHADGVKPHSRWKGIGSSKSSAA